MGQICQEIANLYHKGLTRNMQTYVSVNSKPDYPPGQNPGEFFERANSPPRGTMKVWNPNSWGRKIVLKYKPHPRGNDFQNFSKKSTKHETEIKKNSTEMLICLEILWYIWKQYI